MAELDDDDDDAVEPEKGSKKKLIVIILLGVLVLAVAVGGSLYFMGMLGGSEADAPAHGETSTVDDGHGDAAKMAVSAAPIYFSFSQPFTVNFETEGGLRFLQVGIELMSHDQGAIDAVVAHLPVIQNNIILLFSSQSYGTLISREGKDQLRTEALNEIQAVVKEHYSGGSIDAAYFTSFVIQ